MPDPVNVTLRAVLARLLPGTPPPVEFVCRMLDGEAGHLAPDIEAGLATLEADGFADLPPDRQDAVLAALPADGFRDHLARLAAQGHYTDPAAWPAVGFRPGTWPEPPAEEPPTTPWERMRDAYDAVIVGSGAGGSVAACVLAEGGLRVLVVERGPWLTAADLQPPDHLRNQRIHFGVTVDYDAPAGPPNAGNPRLVATGGGDVLVWPREPRWGGTAATVGGGTRVFGAQAWRFCPEDFRMASIYGTPPGSALRDWPITYAELAPWYDRAEWELGVSGDPAGNVHAGPRTRGYPMPPVRGHAITRTLARGAAALGWATSPVPLLVNSVPYGDRPACVHCGTCVGFGCPVEAKNDSRVTVLARALATGRCDVVTGAVVARVGADGRGRVTGVRVVGPDGERREVRGDRVVLAAGAVETARLLLNSATDREPHGLGNNHDQVGRHLQGHVYAGAFGLFDEPVQEFVGPGPSIATNDFRHHNAGVVGGGMLCDDFVPNPLQAYGILTALGRIPRWGSASVRGLREHYRRLVLVTGPIQEMSTVDDRVTVEPSVRDRHGIPVARLSGALHPEDVRAAVFLSGRAAAWLDACGPREVIPFPPPAVAGPRGGQHQAGTCRMGEDPATSVTDRWGTVWGHDNLHIVDGSVHVTNGGVNPVLTILALAYRSSSRLLA